jgi:hypothetical protein
MVASVNPMAPILGTHSSSAMDPMKPFVTKPESPCQLLYQPRS